MMYGRLLELQSRQLNATTKSAMSITPVSSVSSSQSSPSSSSVSPSPILPTSPPVRKAHARDAMDLLSDLVPVRIIYASIWIMIISTFVTWDVVVYGCLQFISNLATCLGLAGILIIASLPIVYGIIPEETQTFKLVSLCPGIEYAFHKLDDFIATTKQGFIEGM